LKLHWAISGADLKSNNAQLSDFSTISEQANQNPETGNIAENQTVLCPDSSDESVAQLTLYNSKLIVE
jgi:hypothetical protein